MEDLIFDTISNFIFESLFVIVAILLLFQFVFLLVILIKRRKEINQYMENHFKGQILLLKDESASFFGVKSAGPLQVRGNGIMAMTGDTLFFAMFLPYRIIEIPLAKIRSVSTPKSFLGKSTFKKLLQIDFIDDGNIAKSINKSKLKLFRFKAADIGGSKENSAAWYVKDLAKWVNTIESRI